MKEPTRNQLSKRLRQAAMAIVASGIVIAPPVHANSTGDVIIVPATKLPELARQPGDAMFLRDTNDGRAVPSHVRSEGSVQLGNPGPFDFVSPLAAKEELVRFRLHKAWLPSLKPLPMQDYRVIDTSRSQSQARRMHG